MYDILYRRSAEQEMYSKVVSKKSVLTEDCCPQDVWIVETVDSLFSSNENSGGWSVHRWEDTGGQQGEKY